jgi:hypothetical protein
MVNSYKVLCSLFLNALRAGLPLGPVKMKGSLQRARFAWAVMRQGLHPGSYQGCGVNKQCHKALSEGIRPEADFKLHQLRVTVSAFLGSDASGLP